jgi:hypothetical protein
MAESQLSELQNMRVLLEEARGMSRNLAYHRRARLEARIGEALEEVDQQIVELRADRGLWRSSKVDFGHSGRVAERISQPFHELPRDFYRLAVRRRPAKSPLGGP